MQSWFEKHNFSELIINEIKLFDGELLEQLFKISKNAPEYFFKSISKSEETLINVIRFLNELEKLFK